MLSYFVKLVVDIFSTEGLHGWVALSNKGDIKICPITVVINRFLPILVKNFMFREDLLNANIGNGCYGFSIEHNFGVGDRVQIYENITNEVLWEGVLGRQYAPVLVKEVEFDRFLGTQIYSPEPCLNYISLSGNYNLASKSCENFYVIEIEATVAGSQIYYFQTLHGRDLGIDVEASVEGGTISMHQIGEFDGFIFNEYFLVVDENPDGFCLESKTIGFQIGQDVVSLSFPILHAKCTRNHISVYTNDTGIVQIPNIKIDFQLDTISAVPSSLPVNNDYNVVVYLKNSIVAVTQNRQIKWIPEHLKCTPSYGDQPASYNILRSKLVVKELFLNFPELDLNSILRYYKLFGARALVGAYYSYILQREADDNGLDANEGSLKTKVLDSGPLVGCLALWNSFITSEEFLNSKKRVFCRSDSECYPFSFQG